MKNMKALLKLVILIGSFAMLFGCGGGGGDSSSDKGGGAVVQPTTAVLKLSAEGTLPAGTSIAGIGITITLPSGVTVKTDSDGKVASEVVVASGTTAGKATFTPPNYTAATATAPATLSFVLASTEAAGFGTGEFATVTCDVASGASPKATDVTLGDFKPIDLKGVPIQGLSAAHTMELK